jgi:hypothetical protein
MQCTILLLAVGDFILILLAVGDFILFQLNNEGLLVPFVQKKMKAYNAINTAQ